MTIDTTGATRVASTLMRIKVEAPTAVTSSFLPSHPLGTSTVALQALANIHEILYGIKPWPLGRRLPASML